MGKNAGHILTYKDIGRDPEDVRRVQEIEANLQPKSLNSFPANPDVKQLLDRQLAVVDDGTDRYIAIRIGDSLFRINLTNTGDFVQVEGDTMTGQLKSTVASGAPPFVIASGDVVDILNVDKVDGFDLDQSLLIADSPEFVALTLSSLTASRLTATNGSKVLVSVAALTAWVSGTTNQITITDDGDGTITISTPQDIHTGASPVFAGLTLSGLTAARLMATDGSKGAESVAALTAWVAGTANQITVTDDGDGTVTLSTPQNIDTGASPTFAGMTLSGLTALRLTATDGSKALESVAALTSWIAGTVNQIIVTDDGDGTVTLSLPQDIHTGAAPTFDGITLTGPTILEPDDVNITAAGGITVTASEMHIQGDGGPVDITANPQIAAGTDGQTVLLEGSSDTNTVKLDNGTGLHLHGGSYTMRNHDYIYLSYDSASGEWQEITRSATATEKVWSFLSQVAGSGTNYFGGFYIFNSGDDDFTATQTLGVANTSYAAHVALVLGANTVDDLTIRISGTSMDDEGNRNAGATEDVVFSHPAFVDDYVETEIKWIGQVSIDHISGTAKTCNWLFAKYWDNQNSDFIVLGLEAIWRGGANDNDPDLQLLHHMAAGWTFNSGAAASPPAAIASMKTDHGTEHVVKNNVPGAWKRADLNTEINGSASEGVIMAMVTNNNKTFEMGDLLLRVRPN